MERILRLTWDPRALWIWVSLFLAIRWSRLVLFGPTSHRNYIDFSSSCRSPRAGSWLVVYILLNNFLWITRLTTSKANCLTSPTHELILRVLAFNLFGKRPGWSPLLCDFRYRSKLFGSEIIVIILRWIWLLCRPSLIFGKILSNLRLAKRDVILWVVFFILNFGVLVLQQLVSVIIRLVLRLLLNMVEVIWIYIFRLNGLSLPWTWMRIFSIHSVEIIFHVWTISTPVLHVGVI